MALDYYRIILQSVPAGHKRKQAADEMPSPNKKQPQVVERQKVKLGKNNFVVTFKTEDEVLEYFKMHNADEQRLLWLGFFICNNYIAQRLEDEGMELAKPWPPKEKK